MVKLLFISDIAIVLTGIAVAMIVIYVVVNKNHFLGFGETETET